MIPIDDMELSDYKRTFDKLKEDIAHLDRSRINVEDQLSKLIIQRDALVQPILGEELIVVENAVNASIEAISSAGISPAVRMILDGYPHESFTAATMRDRLAQRGWDWSKYINPLATVHSVLVRLAKAGHAKEDTKTNPDGAKSFYSSKRPSVPTQPILMPPPGYEKGKK
jgi:hypothetical protein